MSRHSLTRALIIAGLATLVMTAVAYAHTVLRRSAPAEDERLAAPPTEIVLHYSTRVDPRLARLQLLRSDGTPVPLDSLRSSGGDSAIVAAIAAPLDAAEYTVVWQVVGTDGHPVRGQFAFTVEASEIAAAPAEPLSDPQPLPPPQTAPQTSEPADDVLAPSYVAVRWLTFATLLVTIGAVVFRMLVLEPVRRGSSLPSGGAADQAASRAAVLGRGAAMFLLLAAGARLLLQVRSIGPVGEGSDMIGVMLFGTPWGSGWLLQVAGAVLALLAFHRATRPRGGGWAVAALAALVLAFTPALSGHAAAAESLAPVAIALDGIHVLVASAWLGTLLVLIVAGVPAALAQGGAGGSGMVADLVNRFSPLALAFAATAAATGIGSALIHFDAVSQLWGTAYGRTLLVKFVLFLGAAAVGAYNWQRVRPSLDQDQVGPARLRRSAAIELAAAAAILLATALLVATPTP